MDPVTMLVSAIAVGAATGLTETAASAIRDSYRALKQLITDRYGDIDLGPIEKRPDSEAKRESLREDLETAGAQDDDELIASARELIVAIRAQNRTTDEIVGIDLADVEAASLNIGSVRSTGDGVRVQRGKFSGDINVANVSAGARTRRRP